MSASIRVVGVSDVSVGYGSPQVPAFINSLGRFYANAECILFEPDQPEKAPRHKLFPQLTIKRITTKFHPHSTAGRIEYVSQVAGLVESLRPDVLVLYCTYSLPVLFKLRKKPAFVIYYEIEPVWAYGAFDVEMNKHISDLVDLLIYPEENRAAKDLELCGYRRIPSVVVYNCANPADCSHIRKPSDRNGRVLYQGTIEEERTFAGYYLEEKIQRLPIDLFGVIGGVNRERTKREFSTLLGSVRYLGHVDSEVLTGIRRGYAYSIVIWNPVDDTHLYASPNKFFESIADGVPPIAAPHPQCEMLIRRYDCGILMESWNLEHFYKAIRYALSIYGTPFYARIVENCKTAVMRELNWDSQFEKVKPFLKV